jgi:adenosylhomocysteinase
MRARGAGADVIVTEVDPLRALEARMDGYRVMPMPQAAKVGDVFVTLTGNTHVVSADHMRLMKDGAIIANSGHFNVELELDTLAKIAQGPRRVREFVDEWILDGKRLYVLGEGRLINLAAAEGHPASVMDMRARSPRRCIGCRSRSTATWPGSSWRRWESRSTSSRRSRSTISRRGTRGPETA